MQQVVTTWKSPVSLLLFDRQYDVTIPFLKFIIPPGAIPNIILHYYELQITIYYAAIIISLTKRREFYIISSKYISTRTKELRTYSTVQ